jgi:hypothetical protein
MALFGKMGRGSVYKTFVPAGYWIVINVAINFFLSFTPCSIGGDAEIAPARPGWH